MIWLRNKKNNFKYALLSGFLYSLYIKYSSFSILVPNWSICPFKEEIFHAFLSSPDLKENLSEIPSVSKSDLCQLKSCQQRTPLRVQTLYKLQSGYFAACSPGIFMFSFVCKFISSFILSYFSSYSWNFQPSFG